MSDLIKWVTVALSIIETRRALGFPVARELVELVTKILNPPEMITPEMWAAQQARKDEAMAAYRAAKPGDINI